MLVVYIENAVTIAKHFAFAFRQYFLFSMPVSNFSIAVLMGHVQDDQQADDTTEKSEKISDNELPVPAAQKGKCPSFEKNTSVNNESKAVGGKEKEMTDANDATLQRKRTSFSRLQQRMLEAKFQRAPYLTIQERNNLATFLQLNSRQVKVWFQNRRNKWKRENRGKFLIQPALEMKSYGSYTSGIENYFSCVVHNPFSQLYFASANPR